jgi:hypothetical protein
MALTRVTGTVVKDASLQNADLPNSGVTANTYGSSAAIPVLTVNDKGIITGVSTASVGGVDNFSYSSANGEFTISTSDGSSYTAGFADTDNIAEGTTNLYFTETRARASFSAGAGIDITNGIISQQSTLDYGLLDGAVTITGDYGSI